MKLKLKTTMSITYVLLALFLSASLLVIANYTLDEQFRVYTIKQQEQTNQDFVSLIKDEISKGTVISHDYLLTVGEMALKRGIILMYNDAQGKQIFCMSCVNDTDCTSMIEGMEHTMQSIYPDFKGEYTQKTYPVVIGNNNQGIVTLGYYGPFFYSAQDVTFINSLNQAFLISSVVFLIVSMLLGYVMANLLSQPLQAVSEKTNAIAQGNYYNRIEMKTYTTELDQLIMQVNYLASALQQQQDDKRRMAHDYAHEFRTPLAALQSQLEAMIDGVFPITNERLESCRQEIIRLNRMVSGIDKIVEVETPQEVLNLSDYDLANQIHQLLPTFEKHLLDHHLQLVCYLQPCLLTADYDKIGQVLINLISNAIKYSKPDGLIIVTSRQLGNEVIITIKDEGIGIPPKDLPYIFEHLYRADQSRTRSTGGSGIGLALVKAYVQAHHGTINVKSLVDQGSTFIITLPSKQVV